MKKLFQMIPSGFFNCLSSGSNSGVYSDCLQIIYDQYDREISYRISRSHIRDSLAVYLLENHVDFVEEDEKGARKNYNDLANGIIRKFCSKEVGWLEEEHDDATYEKYIIMTEQGILLAEFLQQLRAPEREEFSSYIYNIYNVLKNEEQWSGDPYVEGLRNVYRNAKMLSKSLKRLSTFIKKIIERMVQEETLESLTGNILEYCEGSFIREYARLTNHKYRSIGLGVSGYHHMLAKRGIRWESEEHLAFADAVFERINYAAIRADTALAREKGCYALFEGSDWQTGAYFEKRGYTSDKWRALADTVAAQGMRNAYLLAVAPTSSTSILSGTTAGIDPVMRRFFLEEKKGSILPRVAPELSLDTWWYYKAAHLIDQSWSVRAAGVRQRHIDQAQSMNLYITNDYTMRQVLALYLDAWRSGVKTIYYIRSKSLEVEDCESCAS